MPHKFNFVTIQAFKNPLSGLFDTHTMGDSTKQFSELVTPADSAGWEKLDQLADSTESIGIGTVDGSGSTTTAAAQTAVRA